MTVTAFLSLKPIPLILDGKPLLFRPHIKPGGLCSFRTDPIEMLIPTPTGHIRISGRFTLVAHRSKFWDQK